MFIKIIITTGARFVSGLRHRLHRGKEEAEIASMISMFHVRRQLGRPISRWKHNIKTDLTDAGEEQTDWMNMA
jgi:hypothetical protein